MQEESFHSPEGFRLNARTSLPAGKGRLGVVLCHMEGESLESWRDFAEELAAGGAMVCAFDFRGHGSSEGDADLARLDLDVCATAEHLGAKGVEGLVLIGAGMGATAALMAAARCGALGVVALSPFLKYRELDGSVLAREARMPKLLLVGARDEVGQAEVAEVFRKAIGPSMIRHYPVADHGSELLWGEWGRHVREDILLFVHRCAARLGDAAAPGA